MIMANGKIQAYADFINQQVAAESFLRNMVTTDQVQSSVKAGNTVKSKEPSLVATQFGVDTGRYRVIAHQDLTLNSDKTVPGVMNKSGMSATVLFDTTTNTYTLSIRSTEMGAIFDGGDVAADIDIGLFGWAFAELKSLEAFWSNLLDGSARDGQNAVTIASDANLLAMRTAVSNGALVNVTG
jgi:hypothetical protein